MTQMEPRVLHGLLFYAIVMSSIVVYRPAALFRDDAPIPFGVGAGKTVFDFGTATSIAAIGSFALFALVDIVR